MNLLAKSKEYVKNLTIYLVLIFMMIGCSNSKMEPFSPEIPTEEEEIEKISTDELLDLVQKRTFNYFWDFAEPNSGCARERSQDDSYDGNSPRLVATGATGFGISCFPVAVTRGWITREEAIGRMNKICSFLENCDSYHGAYGHWYYGDNGHIRPFSGQDDGIDLVETAFLMQGMLINRQFFNGENQTEIDLRNRITALWEAVEWNFFDSGDNILSWHWSPNHNFAMGHKVGGWNEALIVYVLAAASPTHTINKGTYENGWFERGGKMYNNGRFYGIKLPLGIDYGGPMFWSHYSFIGLDPRNLEDQYANYWEQVTAHARINYAYCKANPKGYEGYGGDSWGLTSSDNYSGYGGHHPGNDVGVIAPTAALASFPYTPEESTKALEYFYYKMNRKLWGTYGFFDAFSEHYDWYSDGYIGIDQGPIVAMIENYRTQLLWNLFMADQEVKDGLTKLGFSF
ncbi:glucoamylase family protein [Marinifilum sp. D737]|uniref:glucoamylase family protein n=1 Tax=Marinifilum sp. D737 TaxID=2969628 RepID=UPI00227343B2|nr:glucoamylase family protein [Marinifilum sp. D737]MCY1633752.1 beta-glucosidase [Marinifilum sp. D737]